MRKINGIIFDLDGTLIDSLGCWENADRRFLIENSIDPDIDPELSEKMKMFSMREAAEYFINLGVEMSCDDITERIEQIVYDEYACSIKLKPYVCEFLDVLDRYKKAYCIATANYRSLTEVILEKYGILDRFRFIYTCAEADMKKDSPGFYEKVASMLGYDISEVAVIDDTVHCIEAAGKAGFYTVSVLDKLACSDHKKLAEISDISITSFEELIKKAELIF